MAVLSHPTPLRLWLRRIAAIAMLSSLLGLLLAYTLPVMRDRAPMKLTLVESAHLELTGQTLLDLRPDFSHSISEPLKRMIPHRTDGLVQPLWAWVAAWMHHPEDVGATLRGSGIFRLGLAIGFLAVLGLVATRSFSLPAAMWVVLMAALHGFLPVLPSFTGEVLHQILFLALWLACLYALQRNSLWVYGVVGAAGALAWLAEDRLVVPVILVFMLVSSLRALWGWVEGHFRAGSQVSLWVWRNHWLGLLMLAAMFFFIAGPRLQQAHQQFGEAFFSHVDHARWLATPGEGMRWIEQHPNTESLARTPALERPSAAASLGSMSLGSLLGRLAVGAGLVADQLKLALPMLGVMLGLLLTVTLLAWGTCPKARHAGERLHPEAATVVLFVVVAIGACALIGLWDAVVLPVRHLHALVMPLSLTLAWGAESVLRRARRRGLNRGIKAAYLTAMWLMVLWTIFTSHPGLPG